MARVTLAATSKARSLANRNTRYVGDTEHGVLRSPSKMQTTFPSGEAQLFADGRGGGGQSEPWRRKPPFAWRLGAPQLPRHPKKRPEGCGKAEKPGAVRTYVNAAPQLRAVSELFSARLDSIQQTEQQNVAPPPRSRNVPEAVGHRHRPALRQVRWQVPRLRLVRAADDAGAHMRRVQLRQLPEQVRGLRRRG